MWWIVSLVLMVTWLMALITGFMLGGLVHLLAVVAVLIVVAAGGRGHRRRGTV